MSLLNSHTYVRSPIWAQELLLSTQGLARNALRNGRVFRDHVAELERTEWFDPGQLEALQLERLKATLVHAGAHVPFYRDRFRQIGFDPRDLRKPSDIRCIPELTKRDVFDAGSRLLSEVHRGPRFSARTSGTTGMPLVGWRDLHSINRESAFVRRILTWAGMKQGDRRVWIRGDKVVPSLQKTPPFWRHNFGERMLMMSSYHLGEPTAGAYIDAMEQFEPVVIQAYPSSVLLLARYLLSKGRRYRGKRLKSVVTSSETVTDEHRQLIDRAFGCRIFDRYGSMERFTSIATCEQGRYHLMSDYGFTELLPHPDGYCEVVGTTFDNKLMPWIRHRIGDMIVPAAHGTRCECGRHFPVIQQIGGRIEDSVITPDGRHVFMMSNVLDYIPNLVEGQVRQESRDELKLLLVLAPGAALDAAAVRRIVHSYLGDGMRLVLEQVSQVPRTANGKLRQVVRTI